MTTASSEPAPDAIIEGIHRIRQQLLDEHHGDLRDYFEAAVRRQQESNRPLRSTHLNPENSQAGRG